jgi:glycosyltransferase involved in cell wall biosynthesis
MSDLPFVSIIIPCRNEQDFIGDCLDSILANEYPKTRLEVLVVDGMSEDRTRSIAENYAQRNDFIRCIDNPKKITPAALNRGIDAARGDILMRMDVHAWYSPQYIAKCVNALDRYPADDVGGIWKIIPRTDKFAGQAIVRTLSHPFGIGNAHYRLASSSEPLWVDTVPFFCCRKEVFRTVGFFNEKLVRTQDMEHKRRLKKAGGKILLVPEIANHYYGRCESGVIKLARPLP